MKTCLECLPCLGRNAVDIAARAGIPDAVRHIIVARSLRLLADCDMSMPPPFYARRIMNIGLEEGGSACGELYAAEKECSAQLAELLLKELPSIPEYDPDSFESRLRLAVAGNILDFGIFSGLDIPSAVQSVKLAFTKTIDSGAAERLKAKMDSAEKILYLLDNCGESVFDRVFMEPYRGKITLGVRGCACLNDVTAGDLASSGFSPDMPVVSNGTGIPGTIPECTPPEFQKAFAEADLIIAKGQGNFETLNGTDRPAAFLFLVKCGVVARELGAELNSIQIITRGF